MKRIVFRADAGKENGTGDLLSFVYLADYFKGWSRYFIVKDTPAARKILRKYSFGNIKYLKPGIGFNEEIKSINDFIRSNRIEAFFVEIAREKLSGYSGVTAPYKACVDFSGEAPPGFDLVINWDLESSNVYKQRGFPHTRFLLGPQYTLLRKEIIERANALKKISRRRVKAKNILIFFGGYDEFDFTLKAAMALEDMKYHFNVRLILGAGYPFIEQLKDFLKSAKFCSFRIYENVVDMTKQYCWADEVVVSGGLTLFEAMALKKPVIAVATYKHQIKRCDIFSKKGIIKFLGFREFKRDIFRKNIMNCVFYTYSLRFRSLEIPEIVNDRLREKSVLNISKRRVYR